MVVRIPLGNSSEVYGLDFRETAPAAANATMYVGQPMKARIGGLSVAIPSEIRGLAEAHHRWGKLPWQDLVQPSADIARGWRIQNELAFRLRVRACCDSIVGHPLNYRLIDRDMKASCLRIPTGERYSPHMASFFKKAT